MKSKTLLKLILIVVFFAGAGGAGSYFLLSYFNRDSAVNVQPQPDELFGWKYPITKFPELGSGDHLAYSTIRDPGGIPQGLPIRLKIPVIGVDSAIEDALITPDGRMDVPAGSVNVAWFALGPHPGQVGSAVIGGHYGISNGVPFVFYNLDKLKIGDKIYIEDDKGDTLAFIVRSTSSFERSANATDVFESNDGLVHLNIITCEGVWNAINGTYPQRLVVFSDLISPESPAASAIFFPRTFGMGARGDDVAALQTFLEQKGFLVMPVRAAKGYFGVLTKTALAKYQKSIDLSPVGVFGPLTRTKLVLEQSLAVKPILPSTAIAALPQTDSLPMTIPQIFIQSAKSLFATPMDGLITSILLFLIVFMIIVIIRRLRVRFVE